MTRLHFVKKARKDYPEYGIKKGDSYYWWGFRFGGIHKSKERPKRSQLTQSSFYASLYDLEDRIAELSADSQAALEDEVQDITSEIESIMDECQESLDNMPYQLQEAETGQLIQERIDNLESWKSDIENVDLEIDEEELRATGVDNEVTLEDLIREKIQELIEEIQGYSADC